jgi:hypothetical protein
MRVPFTVCFFRHPQFAGVEHFQYLRYGFLEFCVHIAWRNVGTAFECFFNGTLELIHKFPLIVVVGFIAPSGRYQHFYPFDRFHALS